MTAPARPNSFRHGLKKPEIAYLPTACTGTRGGSRRRPCFRAAVPIWDGHRGNSRGCPTNPHTFLCTHGRQGYPPAPHCFRKRPSNRPSASFSSSSWPGLSRPPMSCPSTPGSRLAC